MNNQKFGQYLGNTITLSLYTLIVGFPLPIIYALLLNTVTREKFKKTVQTISYMPHFISTVIFVGILNMVFSPVSGIYGNIYRLFGGVGFPTDFRATAAAFRHLYIWSGEWQGLGWSAIIYLAALSGVSQELHEAAQMDCASRFKRIWHIDIPAISTTIAMKLVLAATGIIGVGFEKAYLLQKPMNLEVSEVISTYVYKKGMSSFRNYSYGAAVGLFNTVINLVLLFAVNGIVDKATDGEVSMF
jgi:putative aldouronate transport system permease protein